MFQEMEVTIKIECFGLTVMVGEAVEYVGFLESENPFLEMDPLDQRDADIDLDDRRPDND